jgi:hypothetical protein
VCLLEGDEVHLCLDLQARIEADATWPRSDDDDIGHVGAFEHRVGQQQVGGRAGFIAAMKSCFCRSAAAGSFGGGGSFSTSQPASSSNAMQATVHSRHPSRAIGRSINGTKGAV